MPQPPKDMILQRERPGGRAMPQLKADEWPGDEEPTTTEREVPTSDADAAAVREFRARAPRRKQVDESREQDERQDQ